MSTDHAPEALTLALGVEAGFVTVTEVIEWADQITMTEIYDDLIAEVSMGVSDNPKDVAAQLREVAGGLDVWVGVRRLMPRLYSILSKDAKRLHEITKFLERMLMLGGHDAPDDLHFIYGVEDDYLLAESGQYGTLDEVRAKLLGNLTGN